MVKINKTFTYQLPVLKNFTITMPVFGKYI